MEYKAKYKDLNIHIPQVKRKEINEKILYMIDNNLCEKNGFNKEMIFNTYTGDGGTFDLKFNNYNSFYEYSQEKKNLENGQFFTQQEESKKLIELLQVQDNETVLDLTCGSGSLFNYLPNLNNAYGNEVDIKSYKVCKYLYGEKITLTNGDMRNYNSNMIFDLIIGNPPFNIRMKYKEQEKNSQMIYIMKANELLKKGGLMGLIVPESFLNDEFSDKGNIAYINENFNFIGQFKVNQGAFKKVGVDSNFKIKMMFFVKKSEFIEEKNYINEFITEKKIKENIEKIRLVKEKNRNSIKLENLKNYTDEDQNFEKKVTKLLFDIRRTRATNKYYNECFNYYQLYFNQKQPKSINNEEWEKIKVTKKKVIDKLKFVLSNQHGKKVIKSENKQKVLNRRLRVAAQQSVPFASMRIDKKIDKWLSESKVYNYDTREKILLNKEQKKIVNLMLQKKYGYIQASQGTGKTLMSIHYALYREKNTKNTLVIAPSIAINQTWVDVLESYHTPFKTINKLKDLSSIEDNDFILITFNMLCKYKKHVKKFLEKKINNKYTLIVDEADSICNINSSRTKATLSIGKKAKFKLLLSGTMTRNDIAESYTQFKLLYGESLNFICKCREKFTTDKETKELKQVGNIEGYNKPFPAFKAGYRLFRECFNPQSITVFGVGKNTQNIYNSDILKQLINATIITKTFEEVVGEKIYSTHQHIVNFNNSEKKLYSKAINEFYSMKYLFNSTGNPRKDRMMEIIQQLNLLLDICSQAPSYREYNSKDIPEKYKKVLELLNRWESERVIIGCRTIKEVNLYKDLLEKKNIKRKLYIITGSISMKKRKEIIESMRKEKNSILLCTQQSLSSSVNIEFIDKCIITRLSWNLSTLSQFYFRIIRYNSKRKKEVHFITYGNSLESNLLQLLITKENLTNFMKNMEETDMESELGIDFNLLDMLLTKEKDKEGRVKINWGEQKVS